MKRLVATLLVLIAAACPAQASKDPRVKEVVHTGAEITRLIVGRYPALIELPTGESPVAVVSDGNGSEESKKTWEINWKKGDSFVFVQPMLAAKAAQLIIRTSKSSYLFDLIPDTKASLDSADRAAKIVIKLPEPKIKLEDIVLLNEAAARVRADKEAASRTSAVDSMDAADSAKSECPTPTRRNEKYTLEVVKEAADIKPREVFDDGRMTYMRFPNNLSVPAIYKSIPGTQDERLVNSHQSCDYVALHGVARLWNLRLGGSVVGVFNEDFDEEGVPPPKESTIAGQARVVK